MRKAFKNKFAGPKKLFRRVLSKSTEDLNEQCESTVAEPVLMSDQKRLGQEIGVLKQQISNLKTAISTLQNDAEEKEVALANIAREKEKLTLDLLKLRRTNSHLAHQLDNERKFYHQEKEQYCNEMNEIKKLKKTLSAATVQLDENSVEFYKNEIAKIKHTLNQTLEANYNLSIKFLRMKNTKTCLKTELKTMKLERDKLANEYKTKIENLTQELSELVDEKMKTTSISGSNKKYLQLVKQNSCLVYDNLCLQLEVDSLTIRYEKLLMQQSKNDSNNKLKYIKHSSPKPSNRINNDNMQVLPIVNNINNSLTKKSKRVRIINNETPEKLEKEVVNKPSTSTVKPTTNIEQQEVVTLFERREPPRIKTELRIINEKTTPGKCTHSHHSQLLPIDESRPEKLMMEKVMQQSISKLALFQVSESHSQTSTTRISLGAVRVKSLPDIVQKNLPLNHK